MWKFASTATHLSKQCSLPRLVTLNIMNPIHLIFAFLVVRVSAVDSEDCITYKGTKGNCVNIKQCPFLLNLLRNRKSLPTSLALEQLNKSNCGFEKLDPMVCCSSDLGDNGGSLLPKLPTPTALFSNNMIGSSKETSCRTGGGSDGTCINVNECPSLYAILRQESSVTGTALQVLKQSLCGFEKMTPKVCCSDFPSSSESIASPSGPDHPITSHSTREECVTPRGTDGSCVNIKHCQSMFRLVKQSHRLSYEVSQRLKEAHCGFEKMDPKVCCENEEPSPSSPPVINRPIHQRKIPLPPDVTNHPHLGLLDHDVCGPIPEMKIIGGTRTAVFEFPWMALIAYDSGSGLPEFRCGGSLITKKHVLTAAHCVTMLPVNLRLVGVRLGEHDLSREKDCETDVNGLDINCAEDHQDFSVMGVAVHPDYSTEQQQDDIALILLDGEADFSAANVRPICLPVIPTLALNSKMIVTGWGATESGPRSQTLQKVTLPIVPNEECTRLYKMRKIRISYKQICAGGSNRTDSCSGDSGGPLQALGIYDRQPRNILYGVVSFGPRDCGIEGVPGVYTRVQYYMDWILNTIGIEMYD
ncbi:CLIP domain-containing serine protease 2-like [Diprion similis]|uniref:CLIP domain-containing serine protease 2-like n=1 Tax=Diprion similis TaxID=362088 RepID=UPI001EF799C5|nr:CLIP domain-containing serine protease 2-like [Diprion similis]